MISNLRHVKKLKKYFGALGFADGATCGQLSFRLTRSRHSTPDARVNFVVRSHMRIPSRFLWSRIFDIIIFCLLLNLNV